MDEVLKHLPVTGGQRALQMQKVALFDPVILKEYLKIHLSSLYQESLTCAGTIQRGGHAVGDTGSLSFQASSSGACILETGELLLSNGSSTST